jgi:ribosomal protein S18 acetylase RimI-like enzyme
MKIRQATQEDAPLLSSLCADVQRLHAEHYPQLFKQPDRDDFAVAFFTEMLADPAVTIYIAEANGAGAGYVFCKRFERPENVFNFAFRFLQIEHISVRTAGRRRGIGTGLMAQAEALAKELGVTLMQLDSWEFNTTAHDFFESQGFEKFDYRFWKDL